MVLMLLSVLFNIVVRWCISLNPYSGYKKPPLHGDFEAQRHWMEITYNLPITEWYANSSRNDLQYWGLDYPPLTAYHSWLCGLIAHRINPAWVELFTSRGLETLDHKIFMRATVVVADFIYFPAILAYCLLFSYNKDKEKKILTAACTLLYPGLLLIDHGHFQYNNVSLGLAVWAVVFLGKGWDVTGSVCFCLALNYKQMELYHALPFFCYLFGSCVKMPIGKCIFKFLCLATTVLGTFILIWFPFLLDKTVTFQVIHRVFPVARGIFEDKVSNFWCCLNILVKIKDIFKDNMPQLAAISLGTTFLALVPSSLHLVIKPTFHNFKMALVNSALVFFLFSFQVHEKSILLAAMPVCLLIEIDPLPCLWFLLASTFSMFPLLIRDGLSLPFYATQALFTFVVYLQYKHDIPSQQLQKWKYPVLFLFVLSMVGFLSLCICNTAVNPPQRFPDLWPTLNALYSFGHFALFTLYFHYCQFTNSYETTIKQRLLASVPTERKTRKAKAKKEQ